MTVTDAPRIVTSRLGFDDSHTLERYLATGGYEGIKKALSMSPEEVAAEVDAASLLGRGERASRRVVNGRCSARHPPRTWS